MPKIKTPESQAWGEAWRNARANMPRFRRTDAKGSATVLMMLLGRKWKAPPGMSSFNNQNVSNATGRGSKPRDPKQQAILRALASPHGSTIAKAMVIKRKLDISKWKYWP